MRSPKCASDQSNSSECLNACFNLTFQLPTVQDADILAELQQCGADSADSRAQNLSKLFSILEQHQAAPVNQEALPSSRINYLTRHAEIALVHLRHEWPLLLIVLVYMDLWSICTKPTYIRWCRALLLQWYIFQQHQGNATL